MSLEFEVHTVGDAEWEDYKKKFNKSYKPEEENEKRKHWEQSVALVNAHNQEAKEGKHTYTQGVNAFSDGTRPATGLLRPKTPVAVSTLEFEVYNAGDAEWEDYKKKFNKSYKPEEENEKRKHWEQSVAQVNAHNQEAKEGKHSHTLGINAFSDGTRPATGLLRPKTPVAVQQLEFELYKVGDAEWEAYKKKFKKSYKPGDENEKRKIWEKSIADVNAHNQDSRGGKHTHTLGINAFSDGTRPSTGLVKQKTSIPL